MKTTLTYGWVILMVLCAPMLNAQTWFQHVYQNKTLHERPIALGVHQDASGSYSPYIIGHSSTSKTTKSTFDLMIMQTDANGNLLYSESFGTSNRRESGQCVVFNNDTLVIGGVTGPSGGNDAVVWRFDVGSNTMIDHLDYVSDGSTQFRSVVNNGTNNVFGGPAMATTSQTYRGLSMVEVDRNNPLNLIQTTSVTDASFGVLSGNNHLYDDATGNYHKVGYEQGQQAWYAQFDDNFGLLNLAEYTYANCSRLNFVAIEQVSPSLFVILAKGVNCSSVYGGSDIIVLVVDASGAIINQRIYGGSGDENPRAMRVSASTGTVVITGTSNSFSAGGDQDVFMMAVTPTLAVSYFKNFDASMYDDLMGGNNTAMQLVTDSGIESALIAAYQNNTGSGTFDVELIKSPTLAMADEPCVSFHNISNVGSGVLMTPRNAEVATWGTANFINQNKTGLPLSASLLCADRKGLQGLSNLTKTVTADFMEISYYPNPFVDEVNMIFEYPLPTEGVIQLFEIDGKLLLEDKLEKGSASAKLNISQLSRGNYILKIVLENGEVQNQEIIKG